jgi:hypothetical protein
MCAELKEYIMMQSETRSWIELSAITTLLQCPELTSIGYDVAKEAIMESIRQAYVRGISEMAKRP